MVVEIPAGVWSRHCERRLLPLCGRYGCPGSRQGPGGKYLLLSPEYDGQLEAPIGGMEQDVEVNGSTEKMFVTQSPSYVNWLILRGFLVDGKPDTASAMFRNGIKIYPLAKAANPPAMKFSMARKNRLTPFMPTISSSIMSWPMSSKESQWA